MAAKNIIQIQPREVYHRKPPVSFGAPDPFAPHRALEQTAGPVFFVTFRDVRLAAQVRGVHQYSAILNQSCTARFDLDPFASSETNLIKKKPYLNGQRMSVKRFRDPEVSFENALLLNFPINYGHWISDG